MRRAFEYAQLSAPRSFWSSRALHSFPALGPAQPA